MNRQEKEALVAELREKLERSKATVVTDYRGLKVTQITDLRQKLKDAGVEYRVVKNTLTRLAAQSTVAAPLLDHLTGPCALAFSYDDDVTPARLLLDYAKTNDKLEVRAGVIAGRLMLQEDMKKVINLPPKAELQSQLLGAMGSLPSRLLGVMNGVPQDFVNVLAAVPRNLLGLLKAIGQEKAPAS
ncbi:MAG: 50S ribosomal protein L10 [Deltaproteobacteria bacterium]|nr:MAG: 50S ribosomal protein L10 [Deltaproteobacteria bacterium]